MEIRLTYYFDASGSRPFVDANLGSVNRGPGGFAHALAETRMRVPCASRVLRGFLADIAVADYWINAELLTTNRCPLRLNLYSAFGSGGIVPGAAPRPILGTRGQSALYCVLMQVIQLFR